MKLEEIEVLDHVPIIEGGRGMGCRGNVRWGTHGTNAIIHCPVDVDIRDATTGKILSSITKHGQEVVIAKGGIGGKGLTGMGLNRREWNSDEEKERAR